MLLWTPARQDVYNQMKADYDANPTAPATLGGQLYAYILGRSNAGAASYSNYGLYDTFLFQTTGDTTYAARAWTQLNATGNTLSQTSAGGDNSFFTRTGAGLGGNFAREYSVDLVLMYDWLYPYLDSTQRSTFVSKLNDMFTYHINTEHARHSDSDQTCGEFFSLAAFYELTNATNPTIVSLWSTAAPDYGGLNATGADFQTRRNAINYYATVPGAGGEWVESTEYNLGTPVFVYEGVECLRTTPAGSCFPELDALAPQMAKRLVYMQAPDNTNSMQWGDDQNPRAFDATVYKWLNVMMTLVGVLSDGPERQHLQRKVIDLVAKYGLNSTHAAWARAYLLYNPYATAAASLSDLDKGWYAQGAGLSVWQDGFGAQDSQAYIHFPQERRNIDHMVGFWGDFQLYRKGEFAVTHPIGYSTTVVEGPGAAYLSDVCNGTTIKFFSSFPGVYQTNSPFQFRRVVGQKFSSDYAYACGTQGGAIHVATDIDGLSSYSDPPPAFCNEHTRSVLYLPSVAKTADVFIVYERVNAFDPQALVKFARYRTSNANEQSLIPAAHRWESHLHPRTTPTVSGNKTSWTTAGGQIVRDEWLLPDVSQVTINVEDETVLSPYDVSTTEKKWRVRIVPNVEQQWNTLLRVVSARDVGASVASTLLSDSINGACGVLVSRSGDDDRIVLFNSSQGVDLPTFPTSSELISTLLVARLKRASFNVSWTQTTANAKVIACDLDASLVWSCSVDGAAAVALPVDSNGIAEISVASIGVHTLSVSSTPVSSFVYNEGSSQLTSGAINWSTATIKARLIPTSVMPNRDDSTMTGATALGVDQALSGRTKTKDLVNDRIVFDADDPTFTGLPVGSTAGGVIVYLSGASDALSVPIAFCAMTNTVTNGSPLKATFDPSGAFHLQL
jgi:hypothetical protein